MAIAPPLQSTVNDDLTQKLLRTKDLTGAQFDWEPLVRGGLANSLADNANKRQMAISQQNADTARFAAEQEARALEKAIDMNRTALPFQLAQQAFGAQGLLPWLFGGTSGQGEGATTSPGVVNQIGGGLSSAYNWLTGSGANNGTVTGLEGNPDQWTGQAASDQMNALSIDNSGQSGSDAGIQNALNPYIPQLVSGAGNLLDDISTYSNDLWGGLSDYGLGDVFGNVADDWGNIDMGSWWGNGDIFSNMFSTNEVNNLFKDFGGTDMFSDNYSLESINDMFGDWGF